MMKTIEVLEKEIRRLETVKLKCRDLDGELIPEKWVEYKKAVQDVLEIQDSINILKMMEL